MADLVPKEQIYVLFDYLELHREMLKDHDSLNDYEKAKVLMKWREVTFILNNMGATEIKYQQLQKFWEEIKSKAKKKRGIAFYNEDAKSDNELNKKLMSLISISENIENDDWTNIYREKQNSGKNILEPDNLDYEIIHVYEDTAEPTSEANAQVEDTTMDSFNSESNLPLATTKHVTRKQLRAMEEYIVNHDIMSKSCQKSRILSRKLWVELAQKLNSMGDSVKSPAKWRKTWTDYTFRVRKMSRISNDLFSEQDNVDYEVIDTYEDTAEPTSEADAQPDIEWLDEEPHIDESQDGELISAPESPPADEDSASEDVPPIGYLRYKPPTQRQQDYMEMFIKKYPIMDKYSFMNREEKYNQVKLWKKLTNILNNMEGAIKPTKKWRKTWADKKHRDKRDKKKNEEKNPEISMQIKNNGRAMTTAQMDYLVNFISNHPVIELKNSSTVECKNLWRELTTTLNSMGGAVKTIESWRKAWSDVKFRVKIAKFKSKRICRRKASLEDHDYIMENNDITVLSDTENDETANDVKMEVNLDDDDETESFSASNTKNHKENTLDNNMEPTENQMKTLIDFTNSYPRMLLMPKSYYPKKRFLLLWKVITYKLNNMEGPVLNANQWRKACVLHRNKNKTHIVLTKDETSTPVPDENNANVKDCQKCNIAEEKPMWVSKFGTFDEEGRIINPSEKLRQLLTNPINKTKNYNNRDQIQSPPYCEVINKEETNPFEEIEVIQIKTESNPLPSSSPVSEDNGTKLDLESLNKRLLAMEEARLVNDKKISAALMVQAQALNSISSSLNELLSMVKDIHKRL